MASARVAGASGERESRDEGSEGNDDQRGQPESLTARQLQALVRPQHDDLEVKGRELRGKILEIREQVGATDSEGVK